MESEALFSKREVLEAQDTITLSKYRETLLSKLSDLESEIHLINDVIENGYGEVTPPLEKPFQPEAVTRALGRIGIDPLVDGGGIYER